MSESYICKLCRKNFERSFSKCPACAGFNTVKTQSEFRAAMAAEDDEREEEDYDEDQDDIDEDNLAVPIEQVSREHAKFITTGISELDRVLGGGAVLGGITLVGGDPGVGKSTLLLQALACLSALGVRTLYVSGEETSSQVALRSDRIENVEKGYLHLLAETRTEQIIREIHRIEPEVLVIDSLQTIHTRAGDAGDMKQLRLVTKKIIRAARVNPEQMTSVFLVCHVNKEGVLAGPKVIEHLVDTVLAFEGEEGKAFRTLRAKKNRFGDTSEVGVFEMTAEGMQEVQNPSEFFLAERNEEAPGSVICATSEGNRPMLVEVQALVSGVQLTGGRISATGVSLPRLTQVMAVLEKALEGRAVMGGRNIFINLPGGMSVTETALDLPMALAIASSLLGVVLPPGLVAFGEIGLTGEIRGVPRTAARLSEAATMQFDTALIPLSAEPALPKKGKSSLDIRPVGTLAEAIELCLGPAKAEKKKSARK